MPDGFLATAHFSEVRAHVDGFDVLLESLVAGPERQPPVVLCSNPDQLLDLDRLACRLAESWRTIVPDLRAGRFPDRGRAAEAIDQMLGASACPLLIGVGDGAAIASEVALLRSDEGQATLLILVEPLLPVEPVEGVAIEVLRVSPANLPTQQLTPPARQAPVRSVVVPDVAPHTLATDPAGVDAICAAAARLRTLAGPWMDRNR